MTKTKYPTTSELIRAEIERLHQRGKGADWKALSDQVATAYKPIQYNLAQQFTQLIPPSVKELDLEWGRGTGKTTVIATFSRHIAQDLPRGVFQWLVPTYQKFLTEIIPAYIHALEMQGLYKDLHYFIGRRPPKHWGWPEPYKPPLRYDNYISLWTGFGMQLLSQDVPGAGRGPSTDGEIADEAAMLNKKKMDEDSTPAIRGSNLREFGNRRWFDFRLKSSSTAVTPGGAWFVERQELAALDPKRNAFMRANCLCNLHNLKPGYLEDARRDASDLELFNAEYLNIRPRFVRGGFYALLDEDRHAYTNFNYGHYAGLIGVEPDCRGDADLVQDLPLILGMDWGAAINSMVVSQYQPKAHEMRALKNFFTKGSEGKTQDDLVEEFHKYYQYHQATNNEVFMWYDLTGNNSTGNTKLTRAQQAEKLLREKGWKVRRMSVTGANPRHFEKYQLWEAVLKENDVRLPRVRINRVNCKETLVSMSRAKSKRNRDGSIGKDKSSERVTNPQRELATDLSDAIDQPLFGMFNYLMKNSGPALPDSRVSTS